MILQEKRHFVLMKPDVLMISSECTYLYNCILWPCHTFKLYQSLSFNFSSSRQDRKKWIQILKEHEKLHWKMVSNVFQKFFEISKNASWTFLGPFFNVVFNSKHISSSKHFSKMPLNPWNWPKKIVPPSCFHWWIISNRSQVGKNKQSNYTCISIYSAELQHL